MRTSIKENVSAALLSLLFISGTIAPVVVMTGCEYFDQMPEPKTTEEAIGLAISSITAARVSVRENLAVARISADQAQQMQSALNEARDLADLATLALGTANPEDATTYLDMATIVLGKVEEMLRERS